MSLPLTRQRILAVAILASYWCELGARGQQIVDLSRTRVNFIRRGLSMCGCCHCQLEWFVSRLSGNCIGRRFTIRLKFLCSYHVISVSLDLSIKPVEVNII